MTPNEKKWEKGGVLLAMNGKKSEVQKDFQLYQIPFSLKKFLSRKKNSYIFQELEKIHPFFGIGNSWISKLRFRNGRLVMNVMVQNKGGQILANEKSSVFQRLKNDPKSLLSDFLSEWKILVVILLAAIGIILFFSVKSNSRSNTESIPMKSNGTENAEKCSAIGAMFFAAWKINSRIFESVKNCGGKILSFKMENGKCDYDFLSCYPEDVAGGENCTVSYKNGEPSFSLSLNCAEKSVLLEAASQVKNGREGLADFEDFSTKEFNESGRNGFNAELRGELKKKNASIIMERQDSEKSEILFSVDSENFKNCLLECCESIEKRNAFVSGLKIYSSSEAKDLFVDIETNFQSENGFFGEKSILNLVIQFSEIFGARKIIKKSNVPAIKAPAEIKKTTPGKSRYSNLEKIGEIVRNDGKRFFYLRGIDGKIFLADEREVAANE